MAVYLDYNATTPLDPRVAVVMQPWFAETFGNPSSRDHHWGWDAAEAVEDARTLVADCIYAKTDEIIFTSGATEGLNAAIKGFAGYQGWERKKIITCVTEHDAVLASCFQLAKVMGIEIQVLGVDPKGHVDLAELIACLNTDKQTLVALMAANNEIGTLHPIAAIAQIVHAAGAVFLCDMTQAIGKMSLDVHASGIDIGVFSAHKMCGPKGMGALFIRDDVCKLEFEPLIIGGGQELGLRGGTLNVPSIVGFGEACRIVQGESDQYAARVETLRDRLEQRLLVALPDIWINGDQEHRIPNTSNIGFAGLDARLVIRAMHDIGVSTRSACSSSQSSPSHVLKAIGLSNDEAFACIRFSLGRFTTEADIDYTIDKVIAAVRQCRQ